MAAQAGHLIDFGAIDPARWRAASQTAHGAAYALMGEEIRRALRPK
ncbi:MAG TPA: hypothetical protein VFE41_05405 [Acetobacteraceae bacterium]|nr:hypothetical protein [Acetobacteraceae bacterium]HTC10944.1 hypothetical protein [Acetobacteraceae bacterium]